MDYQYLTNEERARILESQLLALEREHYTLTYLADPLGPPANPDRLIWLEAKIAALRIERDELTAATPTS